jgi:hypothetical protein
VTAIRAVSAAQGNFLMIANAAMQDTRLSYQARGIIAYVLSLPPEDTQRLTAKIIEAGATNGRESVRSALHELEGLGYYRRSRTNVRGQWVWEQIISDAPMDPQPLDGNPSHDATSENTPSVQVEPSNGNPLDGSPADKSFKDGVTKDEKIDPLRGSSSSEPDGADPDEDAKPDLDAPGARADVENICAHLADRLEQRFGKRPNITKRWRTAARLMIDADGRTEERVHLCITWCQDNEFWQPNIQSLPKLREKYNQLAAQAAREQRQLAATSGAKPSTTDARVGAGLELAAEYAAAENRTALPAGGSPWQIAERQDA